MEELILKPVDFCRGGEETGSHIVFECPKWDEWRVKRWIDGRLRSWETWEDLGLDVWTDGEGEEVVDNVRTFFSQVDLR